MSPGDDYGDFEMAATKKNINEQSDAELKQMCDDTRAELMKMKVRKGVGDALGEEEVADCPLR